MEGTAAMTQRNYTHWPDARHRFFVYDSEGDRFHYYATREERDAGAADVIDENNINENNADGWSENVENIIVGEVTGKAMRRNVKLPPKRADFDCDEDFHDARANFPADEWCDYICDYVICPLDEHDDPMPGEKQP